MSSRNYSKGNEQSSLDPVSWGGLEEAKSLISSKEKIHYTRALKEMQELVKLESLRMQFSRSDSESDTDRHIQQDEDNNETYFSGLSSETNEFKDYGQGRHKGKRTSTKQGKLPSCSKQRKIYHELCEISKGLQGENERLKEWEANLQEEKRQNNMLRKKLGEYEDSLDKLINHESQKRCEEFGKAFEARIMETSEESKRTKLSFKIMKQANDSLKKQNSQLEEQNKKLEEKVATLNNRISNLQRTNEILKKEMNEARTLEAPKPSKKNSDKLEISIEKKVKQIKIEVNSLSETLGTCLDWIAESQLKQHVQALVKNDTGDISENDISTEITSERAFKVIQQIPSILQYVTNKTTQLSFLHFIYWSLLLAEYTQKKKSGLPLTAYRRIGEKLFKSQILRPDEASRTSSDSVTKRADESISFSRENDNRVRMLSEFIILKTIGQADILAKVLEALKADTRTEEGKEMFINYHGSAVLLSFLDGPHKGLLHLSVDVLMQMTVESPFLGQFLESLSTQQWIRTFYGMLKSTCIENGAMEKLSIIVQRLSKIKSNQKYFDNIQFSKLIRNLAANSDAERPFFALNLRSILLNLSTKASTNTKTINR